MSSRKRLVQWDEPPPRKARKEDVASLPIADFCASLRFLVEEEIVDPSAVRVFSRGDELGLSVKAQRNFGKGAVVASYGGRVVFGDDGVGGPYFLRIAPGVYVNGDPSTVAHSHKGPFINDANGSVAQDEENNVAFQTMWIPTTTEDGRRVRVPAILVKATRQINAGDELWADYGERYWRASSTSASATPRT